MIGERIGRSVCVVCIVIGFAAASPAPAADERPNIILILIDDADKTSFGAYGGQTYTPNLDRLAREGILFHNAYVSSTVCTPSRYSFFTGRYAGNSDSKLYRSEVGTDQQGFVNFNVALERDRMNAARVLQDAGYVTGFVGKLHLLSQLDFPEHFGGEDGLKEIPRRGLEANGRATELFRHNERAMRGYLEDLGFSHAEHVYAENLQRPYHHHNPEWTTAAALRFIEANGDRPFFLQYCTTLLHGGTNSWRDSMDHPHASGEGRLEELPEVMTPRDELLETLEARGFEPNSPVAGEAWLDDAVGAVMAKLEELDIAQNTLLIFVADHGRDGKASLFSRGGACVPMMMRWPARIPAGSQCDALVQNIDLAPTFFELAGANVPTGYHVDGRSLMPLLDDGQAESWRDHLYFEMGYARAVATRDWKYIAVRYPQEQVRRIQQAELERLPRLMSYIGRLGIGVRGADHPGFFDADQLYDLRRDPGEMQNLAGSPAHGERLGQMKRLLTAQLRAMGRPFGEFVPGGNAAPSGQVDQQIEWVKQLQIQHKEVTVPPELKNERNR